MKVLIQWATNPPTDWVEYNIQTVGDARRLPRKAEPNGPQVLDNKPGWLAAMNLQGVIFTGFDHIGFEVVNNVLVVTAWNNGTDFGVTEYWGQKWTFAPPAPDVKIQNAINTVQTVTWYGKENCLPRVQQQPVVIHPWEELTFPPANQTLHGVWISDTAWQQHKDALSLRTWREWK